MSRRITSPAMERNPQEVWTGHKRPSSTKLRETSKYWDAEGRSHTQVYKRELAKPVDEGYVLHPMRDHILSLKRLKKKGVVWRATK